MKKFLYIIPGWEETCRRKPYKQLKIVAEKKGYKVVSIKVDWKKPLSGQLFVVEKEAIVFGFSLGAILGWLVAQKYPCKHLILASMTPHSSFKDPKIKKLLIEITGATFVFDINANLKKNHRAENQTIIYGDQEEEKADILVTNTQHELTSNYIKVIEKLL